MSEERSKVVVYRDVEDGYRWRLRSAAGETLGTASWGHREKSSCYEEIRSVMGERHDADILYAAVD